MSAPQVASQEETYWRGVLAGLAAARPSEPAGEPEPDLVYAAEGVELLPKQAAALWRFAEEQRISIASVLRGAWALVLSHFEGGTDVVFGSSVLDKRVPAHVVPVRARISRDSSAAAWLRALHRQTAASLRHAECSLSDLQRWSGVPDGTALFDSIFLHARSPGAQIRPDTSPIVERLRSMRFPCALALVAFGHGHLELLYDRSRFDAAAARRMLDHLEALLLGITSRPGDPISALEQVTEARRHHLLVARNQTQRSYPDTTLHELVQARAGEAPDRVAVIFEGRQVTYGQLDLRSNQLARYLKRLGVGPDAIVGIYLERSIETLIALLGVLKAGAAYLPLDPELPTERTGFMISDARVAALLTAGDLAVDLPRVEAPVVCLDTEWGRISRESPSACESHATPDDVAYVVYTSDAAGELRGVMNLQRGICNRLHWMQEQFGLTPADTVVQKSPFGGDASIWEFFWPLMTGARLVLARPGAHVRADHLVDLIEQHEVTVLHFAPSVLWLFLERPDLRRCGTLRHVFCGGEALPYALQQRFFERLGAKLHHLYGPAEAAIDVAVWTCKRNGCSGVVPIGRPAPNTQILVLDRNLRHVPIGDAGEIHVGGVQLARGYLNQPALTAERFIESPFEPGARLFKTGDLGRYRPDGNLEYLGGIDEPTSPDPADAGG